MTWLLYLANVTLARTESALGKYDARHGGTTGDFNRAKTLAAASLSAVAALIGGMTLHGATVLYAALYGIALATSMYCGLKALSLGNMALVSMIASFSLVIPCLWGLIFLREELSFVGVIGLLLLATSILLLNLKRGGGRLSRECWIYSLLTLLTNGIMSIIQKQHQTAYPGEYKTEFMLFAMVFAFLIFLALGFRRSGGESKPKPLSERKRTFILGASAGALNYLANFSILLLASTENATVLFPILSAANAIGSCLIGRFVFKERLTRLQAVSILLGIASVVLLKI